MIPSISPDLFSSLSEEEVSKSRSFTDSEVRNRFVLAHAALRRILSKYLPMHPSEMEFQFADKGKPFVRSGTNRPPIYFNLSYRTNYALVAVANKPYIGADVEEVKPTVNSSHFVVNFFSLKERERINSTPAEKKNALVLQLWTMKEAIAKATGEGLSTLISRADLTPFLLKEIHVPDFDPEKHWFVKSIRIDEHHAGAVAMQSKIIDRLEVFQFK